MGKALVAIGAATVNVITKWATASNERPHIIWVGSHQNDFVSAHVRDYIGDIVSETADHVVGTHGELIFIANGQTFLSEHEQAVQDQHRIRQVLAHYDDVYMLSSLGGGTTSHVTPFIANVLAQQDPMMQAIVTLPAKLEPRTRHEKAEDAFIQLKQTCPIIHLVTNNGEHEESLVATFARRDQLLATLLTRVIG